MNVTLRQLRAFVLVARLGNFTRAAQAMHVTQSALSLLVRELESALKTRLVNRTTRSVSVTEVGAEFLITAQRVLGDLEHALADIDKMLAKERGRVVIVAPLVLSSVLLPPILASFKARYPRVELILRDTLPDQVLPQVASGMAPRETGHRPGSRDGEANRQDALAGCGSLAGSRPAVDRFSATGLTNGGRCPPFMADAGRSYDNPHATRTPNKAE